MDSLSHFHSKNVYFYIRIMNSFKGMALSIFQNFWDDTNLKSRCVNPAIIFKPEFYILFTILNKNICDLLTGEGALISRCYMWLIYKYYKQWLTLV